MAIASAPLDYEARKRCTDELNAAGLPDPYSIPADSWSEDVTKWPNIDFRDVCTYLIETTGPFTKENLKASKSLKAYNYFCNSYVHTMYCFRSGQVFALKAKVNPSQRSGDKPHESWVAVNKSGSILSECSLYMYGGVS